MTVSPEDILAFWYEKSTPKDWFTKNAEFDERVRSRFAETYEAATKGTLDGWQETPFGALALVITLDQFPRNLFRDSAQSFATDAQALAVTRAALAEDYDTDPSFNDFHRQFLYLPLMHSENLDDQIECVRLCEERTEHEVLQDFARQHLRIVERFGRFPHRNAVLERDSTPEEIEFLKEEGSSF